MLVSMSIIKLEIRLAEVQKVISAFKENRKKMLEEFSREFRRVASQAFNEIMQAEIDIFLGGSEQSDNKKNGFYPEREYTIKGIGSIKIRAPRDRKNRFQSDVIPQHERVDPRLKSDVAVMHLAGLSTRTLAMISQRLLGIKMSKDTISTSLDLVENEARNWLTRPIMKNYKILYVDGTNFKIQRRGSTEREPSLIVLGVDEENFRSILAIEPGTKDNVDSWRAAFHSLKLRGLNAQSVRLGVMDGLPGLENLFKKEFPNSLTQRCWVHALRNALAKTPARLRDEFGKVAKEIMYAQSEDEAMQAFSKLKSLMKRDAQRAVYCLEKDLSSLLTYFKFDQSLWVSLRTTNAIETINRQFKRRTQNMDTLGEKTLEIVLAFTALKIEVGWRQHRIDSGVFSKGIKKIQNKAPLNAIEIVAEEIGLPN